MNIIAQAAIAAAALLCAASPASALTIDFETLAFDGPTNDGPRGVGSPLDIGDFRFTATDPFGLPPILVYSRQSTNNPDFGGASIFPNRPATGLTLQRIDGRTFAFNSVDLTYAFDDQNAFFGGGTATFALSDGTSRSFAFDNLAGFETFTLNAGRITSVTITGDAPFAIDNVVLNNSVPEPASWAMMIGGLGLAGGALRRRQSTAVRYA